MLRNDVQTKIQQAAAALLSRRERRESRLFIDDTPLTPGTLLGPKFQGIQVHKHSVLVFVDDDPDANFGHECRYFLFDPRSGELDRAHHARFPPYLDGLPPSYRQFEVSPEPAPPEPARIQASSAPPTGNRYAILFSGRTEERHFNDLEFAYRMLTSKYQFPADNITVLNYKGSPTTLSWRAGISAPPGKWPGDNSAYRLPVHGRGTRAQMRNTLRSLDLASNDLLFIHTTGHGDDWGDGAFLSTPNLATEQYYATDFAEDLQLLPPFHHLIVMMQQCCSGGFAQPIIGCGCADLITFASAASATAKSYATSDGKWNHFALDWLAAQNTAYPDQKPAQADTAPADGRLSAREVFSYADKPNIRDPRDSPQYIKNSSDADNSSLGPVGP